MVFQVGLPWTYTQAGVPQCWRPLQATPLLAHRAVLGHVLLRLPCQWRASRQPVLLTLAGAKGKGGNVTALLCTPVASHTGYLNCTCALCVCAVTRVPWRVHVC